MRLLPMTAILAIGLLIPDSRAGINGLPGPGFDLTAQTSNLSLPDGKTLHVWGLGETGSPMQYPAPTLIMTQGQVTRVLLRNQLAVPTSLVFPGMTDVRTNGSPLTQDGLLTLEALPGGVVSYTFVPRAPGTYIYHSGTQPELQVEMGVVGVIIVRPSNFQPTAPTAYNHPDTAYDREYLFLLTEMDPRIHELVAAEGPAALEQADFLTSYEPRYWFLNGRTAPDTFLPDDTPWLPNQPYGALAQMHPGEQLLMRVVGGGRDLHPFHHHGNHSRVIGRNGRLQQTRKNAVGLDLSSEVFTVQSRPGETVDALWTWTGAGLGWDVYGHAPGDPMEPGESAADHGKAIPVELPELQDLTFGGFFSGDPFLGSLSSLPPGEGGLNVNGGYHFMWHSHTEIELTNNDIFPGGMMTMLIVEPHGAPID